MQARAVFTLSLLLFCVGALSQQECQNQNQADTGLENGFSPLGIFGDPVSDLTDPFSGLERELISALGPMMMTERSPRQRLNSASPFAAATSYHPMDIVEHPDRFTITADAPGMTPDDVSIEVQDGMLKVSGQKKGGVENTEEQAGTRMHRSERTFSSFTRSFTLPDSAKEEGISATLTNGVLSVNVPKEPTRKAAEPKRITVTSQ
ncbi:HSP20-like chaperone [Dunaliella salina]|uniref:HSP20-like chaperone n=1 Tax=Dunaliella salina TaxID=3046 RepID=A0ABQ7H9H8_DUNSA|nr:HSP20-like chaperone [Dunaliella salina]|eukprot:KAF5843509.1 HSP20-like chaperone [Dunaliella salina]